MASIATTIELYDKVSAPINEIVSSLHSMCQAYENAESSMQSTFNTRGIVNTRNEIDNTTREVNNLGGKIQENELHQQNFNNRVAQGTIAANGLLGKIIKLAATYASIQTLKKGVSVSDNFTQTTARLGMMNDAFNNVNGTAMKTNDLVYKVYQSAQNARGSFSDMAAVVAKFGNNARNAFSSQKEVVDFANLIQKQMIIAGASSAEASNAMLQLSQALGSGVLRGDELNSIFEQAPNLIQSIANYLNVPIGKIREMAQEGQISAEVVKAAIFASADEINAKFEAMPMTWGQVWTNITNYALMAFQPILVKINELANNQQFQVFAANAVNALTQVVNMLLYIMNVVGVVVQFFIDNWSAISPVIYGVAVALGLYLAVLAIVNTVNKISAAIAAVKAAADMMQAGATFAATVAQYGLNAALAACPITWIIILIIALIVILYMVVDSINNVAETSISATGIIAGVLASAGAFIGNLFVTLINFVIDIFVVLWNFIISFANFFANVFSDPINAVARMFFDLVDTVLSLLQSLASAIDTIFGSNLASAVSGWRSSLGGWVDNTFGKGAEVMAKVNSKSLHLKRFEYGKAWDAGYSWGEGVEKKLSNMFNFNGKIPSVDGNIPSVNGLQANYNVPEHSVLDSSSIFNGAGYEPGDYSGINNSVDIPSIGSKRKDGHRSGGGAAQHIANTAENTARTADALDITNEDLKYLRDIADRDVINRFTTAEINVDFGGVNNNINNDMDLDGVIDYLASGVQEAMEQAAEGVHA